MSKIVGNGMRYTGFFSWMRMGLSCVRKGLGGSFYKIFVGVLLFRNTRFGRGRACFVVVGKIGAFISDRFQWILSDISSMPRRNATGVVCIFLIWGIDDVYIVLFSVKPLTVTCAGLSLSLVLIVVFLVVRDRSKQKVEEIIHKTDRIETYTSRFGGKVLTDEKSHDFFNVPKLHPTHRWKRLLPISVPVPL